VIAEPRGLAVAALDLGPLDAFAWVMREQCGQRVAYRCTTTLAAGAVVAPGDDVCARHGAEFCRALDAGEARKIADRILVGPPGMSVADVSKPLELRRHVLELMILGDRQQRFRRGDFRRQLGVGLEVASLVGHGQSLFIIT